MMNIVRLRRFIGSARGLQDETPQEGRECGSGHGDGLADVILFGRVISAGLVTAGYIFLGVWLASRLSDDGWPAWAVFASLPLCALFGLWQGWLFLKNIRGGRASKMR